MRFNILPKLTFPALLLGAGMMAYAANEVQLSNNQLVDWTKFVAVLNGDEEVTGKITDLPAANSALKAYNTANTAYQTANEKVTATGEGSLQAAITAAEGKVSTAASDTANYFDNHIKPAQTAYDAALKAIKDLRDQNTTDSLEIVRQNGLIDGYNRNINTYNNNITIAERALSKLSSSQVTEPIGWLKNFITTCNTFGENFLLALDDEDYNDTTTIYCRWQSGTGTLTLSFATAKPADTYEEETVSSLINYLSDKTIKFLKINLGTQNYPVGTGTNAGILTVSGFQKDIVYIFTDAETAMTNLSKSDDAYGTTETVYKDTQAAAGYQNTISENENLLETANSNLSTATSKVKELTENIADREEQITNYKNEDGKTVEDLKTALNTAIEGKSDVVKAYQDAVDELTEAEGNLETAQKEADAAKERLDAAEATAQAAADTQAKNVYNNVSLTTDVTATTAISEDFAGTINGEDHVITLDGPSYLFTGSFTGTLTKLALNGNVSATPADGKYGEFVRWNGTEGRYYDEDRTASAVIKNLGTLGYTAREEFGVNFATNKLAPLTENTKVFSVAVYNDEQTKTPTNRYVVVDADKTGFTTSSNTALAINANRFAKCADSDIADITDFAVPNVYYTDDEGNNVCPVAEITDKVTFFAPAQMTATTLSYDRELTASPDLKNNAKVNTLCLPFVLKQNDIPGCAGYFIYDSETENSFKFKVRGGDVPANTPVLVPIQGSENVKLNNLQNVTITETEKDIIPYTANGMKSYGNYKQDAMVGDFVGSFEAYKIYGLNTAKYLFQAMGQTAKLPAFRMVIQSENTTPSGVNAAPRKIIFLDEKGMEIGDLMTYVDRVDMGDLEFAINGGRGEIVITSAEELGEVAVYNMNGAVVAMANVTEGTTTINVEKGLYIVMGKKVMVK